MQQTVAAILQHLRYGKISFAVLIPVSQKSGCILHRILVSTSSARGQKHRREPDGDHGFEAQDEVRHQGEGQEQGWLLQLH